jgi:tetratricopeptide (TPR) repeat protein
MSARVSFWQRLGSLFRSEAASSGGDGATTFLEPRPEHAGDGAGLVRPPADAPPASWWRRSAKGVQAREVSLRVVELAHSLLQHFEQQDRRAAELAGSLNRVGGTLEQLAETQRAQGDYLRAIAEQSEAAGKNAAALTATLGRMPESLLSQAEAIRTVARSLELSQEADTQLMHSLQQFGRAVDTLGSSGTAQVDILQRLNAAQREQHQAFTALVREQGRRYLAVFVVAAVLAVAALAVLVATLAQRITV